MKLLGLLLKIPALLLSVLILPFAPKLMDAYNQRSVKRSLLKRHLDSARASEGEPNLASSFLDPQSQFSSKETVTNYLSDLTLEAVEELDSKTIKALVAKVPFAKWPKGLVAALQPHQLEDLSSANLAVAESAILKEKLANCTVDEFRHLTIKEVQEYMAKLPLSEWPSALLMDLNEHHLKGLNSKNLAVVRAGRIARLAKYTNEEINKLAPAELDDLIDKVSLLDWPIRLITGVNKNHWPYKCGIEGEHRTLLQSAYDLSQIVDQLVSSGGDRNMTLRHFQDGSRMKAKPK